MKSIRNFCIIAHVDHGKSTLADRLLEFTCTVAQRESKDQLLDSMDLERERGITIKSHAVQMRHRHNHSDYTLNLIDTPGHVDFSYEVSRSIAACEGALLVVDAAQGIQAQTISNLYLALEQDLTIIPVLNKVDLPNALPEEVSESLVSLIGCEPSEILRVSAKRGIGIEDVLTAIVERVPPPQGTPQALLQAMIFDSAYNPFRGVEVYCKIAQGTLKKGDRVKFISTEKSYHAEEVGILQLRKVPCEMLSAGQVGYIIAGVKSVQDVRVGDTITHTDHPCRQRIQGFKEVKPMVFAGVYPTDTSQYETLRGAMEKLQLNDAALIWEPETSTALGFGFRCGFLGMLHMEIVQERLEREFHMDVITTVPSVQFRVLNVKGDICQVNAPSDMPEPNLIQRIEEPIIRTQIIARPEDIGKIMKLCIDKRGILKTQSYPTAERIELVFELPLAEVVFDFFDRLKSLSQGYASLDYELMGFVPSSLVRLDVLLNGDKVDALSAIVHREKAYEWGKKLCEKLKELLPKQMFEIAIQAAIGAKVIARETVKALRKNVTAKCYGGDVSRKRKLLEKQKEGKKRMRQIGSVEVPQEAFLAILKLD